MKKTFIIAAIFMLLSACRQTSAGKLHIVEVQGHRGDRGNFPENTIPAFISAVKKGADVIELDVVISKDRKVVVSHEPFMSSQYVSLPDGTAISRDTERSYNLYLMDYDSIRKFDTGSAGNKSFPQQKRMKAYKPLLSQVIDNVESYVANHNIPRIAYNIEIKSEKAEYGKSQPGPEEFIGLVMEIIEQKGIKNRMNVQSFDPMVLNILHRKYPDVQAAFLTSKPGIDKNLSRLIFTPDIYSPYYKLVNKEFMDSITALKIKVIPWTVNNKEEIDRMLGLKVDGIITDYPERVIKKAD